MMSQLTDSLVREVFGDPTTAPIVVAYDATAVSAVALEAGVLYRFCSTTDCHVAFAAAPVAVVATCTPMTAGIPEYWKLNSGLKVAAIKRSVAGSLYITKMIGQRV